MLGWVHYSLWGEEYLNGAYEAAYEHACASLERAIEIGHEYMWICALEARLLAHSAFAGEITQPELADVIDRARRHGVHSVAVAALWFVARYASEVDPGSAGRWLALAERIRTELDTARSLESELREETMAVLGITDLGPLLAAVPPFDPGAALDEAVAWVASRSPTEIAPAHPRSSQETAMFGNHKRLEGKLRAGGRSAHSDGPRVQGRDDDHQRQPPDWWPTRRWSASSASRSRPKASRRSTPPPARGTASSGSPARVTPSPCCTTPAITARWSSTRVRRRRCIRCWPNRSPASAP